MTEVRVMVPLKFNYLLDRTLSLPGRRDIRKRYRWERADVQGSLGSIMISRYHPQNSTIIRKSMRFLLLLYFLSFFLRSSFFTLFSLPIMQFLKSVHKLLDLLSFPWSFIYSFSRSIFSLPLVFSSAHYTYFSSSFLAMFFSFCKSSFCFFYSSLSSTILISTLLVPVHFLLSFIYSLCLKCPASHLSSLDHFWFTLSSSVFILRRVRDDDNDDNNTVASNDDYSVIIIMTPWRRSNRQNTILILIDGKISKSICYSFYRFLIYMRQSCRGLGTRTPPDSVMGGSWSLHEKLFISYNVQK